MSQRAGALADRIEQGFNSLAALAETLTEAEWSTPVPQDGRTVGVMVHHVASMYPIEVQLTQNLAAGKPIEGVSWADVAKINAQHSHDHSGVRQPETLALLRQNGQAAADAVRAFSDEQLDRAAAVSLNANAPLTTQFFIEDHALRHSFHHLAKIRGALGRDS